LSEEAVNGLQQRQDGVGPEDNVGTEQQVETTATAAVLTGELARLALTPA